MDIITIWKQHAWINWNAILNFFSHRAKFDEFNMGECNSLHDMDKAWPAHQLIH